MAMTTMITMTIKFSFVILFIVGLLVSAKAQEKPLKDYADARKESKFCFYPSTLRMINISHNLDFDKMVNGIEKFLIYTLDSAARADKSYKNVLDTYRGLGYEELATMTGGQSQVYLLGKEEKHENEFVGFVTTPDNTSAFYLRGRVDFSTLPRLVNAVKKDDFINIFDFNTSDFGKSTQHQ